MKKTAFKIIVERKFPQSGRTLEEIYIDYMADKIVGQITQMKMKPMPLNENKKIAVWAIYALDIFALKW